MMKLKEILQNYKAPVSDAEWLSIIEDPAVARFNRSQRVTRVSLYGAGAALLVVAAVLIGVAVNHPKSDKVTAENRPVQEQVATTIETPAATTTTQSTTNVETAAAITAIPVETRVDKNAATQGETPAVVPAVAPKQTTAAVVETPSQPKKSNTTMQTTQTTKPIAAPVAAKTASKPVSTAKEEIVNEETPAETPEEPVLDEQFFVPNSFTPNGDGINDLFLAKANFTPATFEMSIYSRSGDLVFKSRNLNIGWDGGNHPAGIYNYVIKYTNPQGKVQMKKGQLMMLK